MNWPLLHDRSAGEPLLHDRYLVGEPIGRGRATVYRGTDTRLGRAVALKQVPLTSGHGHESGDRVRTRALREARAAARLEEPTVVTVYDVVEDDDSLWLVMELVDAPSLAQLVADRGPLSHGEAAGVGLAVLRALTAAHRVGVVHRDVKPANVLVPDEGPAPAKLADFGVATVHDETRVTATGLVLGSPAYMAPEQARGEDVTPAADLWALGATLYYAYEGEPPFDGGTALATATAVVHGTPRVEQNPGPLSPLVARLLAKSPDERPSDDEVRAELRAVADSAEAGSGSGSITTATAVAPAAEDAPATVPAPVTDVAAAEVAPARPSPARRRRSPRSVVAAVVVVALLIVATVVALAFDPDDLLPEDDAASPRTTAEATTTEAPTTTAEPDSGSDSGPDSGSSDGTTATTAAPAGDADDAADTGAADVPEGWRTYTDEAGGYTLAYPEGWSVEPAGGPRVDFRDPETGTYLRVDWTDQPKDDPVADWREQSQSFAARHEGYEEIAIEPYSYRDYEAARWEFRYTDGGARLHTFNLGFIAGDQAYALYFQTKEENWSSSQPTFTRFRESFHPAP